MNRQISFYVLVACLGLMILKGLAFSRSTLDWTVDDSNLVNPFAPFLRDYLWHLEWGFTLAIALGAFVSRTAKGPLIAWLCVNAILWLTIVTFNVLEIAVRDVPVYVNGVRVSQ